MLKPSLIAAFTVLALSGAAQASDHHHGRAVEPTAPQPIAAVLDAGTGTVSGTVEKVAARWFVVNDGQTAIDVADRGFVPEGLQSGEPITVVGNVRHGVLQASQIIRADGTAIGRSDLMNGHGRHHEAD